MSSIEQALSDLGIIYTEVEADILPNLLNRYFKDTKRLTGIELTIPDNSKFPYYLFIPPAELCILRMLNVSYERLYEGPVTYSSNGSYTEVTPDASESVTTYKHGDGFLFETNEEPTTVILECLVSDKTTDQLTKDIRLAFMSLYYNLYTNNLDAAYNYIRRISNIKENTVAQHNLILPTRKRMISEITPWEL